MTSGLGAAEQSRPGSGGGGGGGGGSQSYDFRAALGRGSSSGWGGPEEKLLGLVALSSASWPPPPLPHLRSDRVGEVRLPTVRSWAPERHGGHHLLAQGPWMWPSLVWSSGPRQAPWPAEVMARPLPGQTCFTSSCAPTSRPPWVLSSSSACRDFRFLMAPLSSSPSNTRFPPPSQIEAPTLGLPIVAVRQGSASLLTT